MVSILSYSLQCPILEQRAPRLASAGKILGSLAVVASAVNLKLDLLDSAGLSLEEYLGLSTAVALFIMAYFASKERKVIELTDNLSLEEQFEALESIPTKSGTDVASVAQPQSSHTKNIIDSIIGANKEIDELQVSNAIGALSTGEFGQAAQQIAEQLPAPHKESDNVVQSSTKTTIDHDLESKSNIPLPSIPIADEPIIAEIPVLPEVATSPSLPDLTELFEDETANDKDAIESEILPMESENESLSLIKGEYDSLIFNTDNIRSQLKTLNYDTEYFNRILIISRFLSFNTPKEINFDEVNFTIGWDKKVRRKKGRTFKTIIKKTDENVRILRLAGYVKANPAILERHFENYVTSLENSGLFQLVEVMDEQTPSKDIERIEFVLKCVI